MAYISSQNRNLQKTVENPFGVVVDGVQGLSGD